MESIFDKVKESYENGQECLWNIPEESKVEEKLQYLILQQRYKNLETFFKKQQDKYEFDDQETQELTELLFYYNDLKEINFIGTDMYANALFLKHKVPYLYRSVGKDLKDGRIFGNADIEYTEHIKEIFKECLNQGKPGGQSELFSYSKCFGKMLYKYATLLNLNSEIEIEVRKDPIVNAISEDGKDFISIQKYMRECTKKDGTNGLPYFAIDFSNARDNSFDCLTYWIDKFLGQQKWHLRKKMWSPIGDAEVICNFTNKLPCGDVEVDESVTRFSFSIEKFCVLLYKYFSQYAEKNGCDSKCKFESFIKKTLNTIKYDELQKYYCNIITASLKNNNLESINDILKMIDWENEKKYMSRCKEGKQEQQDKPLHMEVYKGDNAEEISRQWKEILFSAIEGEYSHIDFSNCNYYGES